MVVGKQDPAGVLTGERYDAGSQYGRIRFLFALELGQLALGRGGLLSELPGLPPRLGFDCGLGPLLKIEARGLGDINPGFGFTPAGETVGQEHRGQEQGRGRDPDLGNHAGGHHTARRDGNLFPYAHNGLTLRFVAPGRAPLSNPQPAGIEDAPHNEQAVFGEVVGHQRGVAVDGFIQGR